MGGRGSGRPIGPMTDRMRRAAELGAQGKSYREIGEELGVGQGQVSKWFTRDDVAALRDSMARRMVRTMAAKAYRVLAAQLQDPNAWVALGAAREIVRLADQYDQADGQQINVAFAAMPAPGAPASADDDADAAADQSFVSG